MRLSEVYTSVQGEGPNTGDPTTFVRFGGCNLRCPGWGFGKLPDGSEVPGCDTVFAVYPEWRKTWDKLTPQEVFAQTPEAPARICITGGEPLIQPKEEMAGYVDLLLRSDHVIDLFTNGSRPIPEWTSEDDVTVVMDWKMPGSGEGESFNPENLKLLQPKDAVKFVCKDRDDFDVAVVCAERVQNESQAQVFFGVVWGALNESQMAKWVADEYPTGRLNVQLHKLMWDPDERRR